MLSQWVRNTFSAGFLCLLAACGAPAFATCPSTPSDCGSPTVYNITVLGSVIGGTLSSPTITSPAITGGTISGTQINGSPIGLSSQSTGNFSTLSGSFTNPSSFPPQAPVLGTANITQIGGTYSGTVFGAEGIVSIPSTETANTTGTLVGVDGNVFNNGTGTVSYAVGGYFGVFDDATGGTISRGFGVAIQTPSAPFGGTVTNGTGLYIQNLKGATNNTSIEIGTTILPAPPAGNFSIYDLDTYLSYFAGPMEFAGSFTANGSTALSLTNIGPSGASSTVQEWFTVKDAAGTTRYIPAF